MLCRKMKKTNVTEGDRMASLDYGVREKGS